jgi:hypothetical protein
MMMVKLMRVEPAASRLIAADTDLGDTATPSQVRRVRGWREKLLARKTQLFLLHASSKAHA